MKTLLKGLVRLRYLVWCDFGSRWETFNNNIVRCGFDPYREGNVDKSVAGHLGLSAKLYFDM